MSARRRPRQRCVRCTAKQHAALKRRARAAGKSLSRYLLDLALADAQARHRLALSEPEQQALLDGLREVDATMRMVRGALPGCGDLSLFDAVGILARERAR